MHCHRQERLYREPGGFRQYLWLTLTLLCALDKWILTSVTFQRCCENRDIFTVVEYPTEVKPLTIKPVATSLSQTRRMAAPLYKTVSLSNQGLRNPKLARNASVAVPSPVLRSLSNLQALRSTVSAADTSEFIDITFRWKLPEYHVHEEVVILTVACGSSHH